MDSSDLAGEPNELSGAPLLAEGFHAPVRTGVEPRDVGQPAGSDRSLVRPLLSGDPSAAELPLADEANEEEEPTIRARVLGSSKLRPMQMSTVTGTRDLFPSPPLGGSGGVAAEAFPRLPSTREGNVGCTGGGATRTLPAPTTAWAAPTFAFEGALETGKLGGHCANMIGVMDGVGGDLLPSHSGGPGEEGADPRGRPTMPRFCDIGLYWGEPAATTNEPWAIPGTPTGVGVELPGRARDMPCVTRPCGAGLHNWC